MKYDPNTDIATLDTGVATRAKKLRPNQRAMSAMSSSDEVYPAHPNRLCSDGNGSAAQPEFKPCAIAPLQAAIQELGQAVLGHHRLRPYEATQLAVFLRAVNASVNCRDCDQLLSAWHDLNEILGRPNLPIAQNPEVRW